MLEAITRNQWTERTIKVAVGGLQQKESEL
jgi:hypothetical protein